MRDSLLREVVLDVFIIFVCLEAYCQKHGGLKRKK